METTYIIVVLVSLLLSAFFSGVEIAFISSDKLHIELRSQQGHLSDKILSGFVKKPSWFITSTLIGNNVTLVIYGIFMAFILKPLIANNLPPILNNELIVFVLQTSMATIIVLITAEFLPKSLSLLSPNRMLSFLAVPIYIIYILFFPAVWLIVNLSKILIEKVLRLEYSEDKPVFGLIDLNQYIKRMINVQEEEQKQEVNAKIFTNALEFKTVKIRDCLVPRTELVTVSFDDTIEELKTAFVESGYSKVLVYKESIDNIIGYCNSIELFKKPENLSDILIPIIIVPETMLANELMIQFISERKNIALVVDEYGGTSGIVTIEDIMEEIFGEIQDEHDEEDLLEKRIDDENFLLSARHEIDYLNDKYNFQLPEGDYETLGGLILSLAEDFPKKNEKINSDNFTFNIESIENNRIDNIKLTINREKS
ncbi:MAG: HlyC/CorC family transporter [Cyclobacteriaceae bacterium]|nr:HlyC/CorC family transporter [Cyclobacteriaceae bacterium]